MDNEKRFEEYVKRMLGDVDKIRAAVGSELAYQQMIESEDPEQYFDSLMELLITDPSQSPVTARNNRVHYVLAKAVEANRIKPSDIDRHNGLFQRSAEDEKARKELDELWHIADPDNLSHRLALLYAKRCPVTSH